MMEKMMRYSIDTIELFCDWIVSDSAAMAFVSLILLTCVVLWFRQLLH